MFSGKDVRVFSYPKKIMYFRCYITDKEIHQDKK